VPRFGCYTVTRRRCRYMHVGSHTVVTFTHPTLPVVGSHRWTARWLRARWLRLLFIYVYVYGCYVVYGWLPHVALPFTHTPVAHLHDPTRFISLLLHWDRLRLRCLTVTHHVPCTHVTVVTIAVTRLRCSAIRLTVTLHMPPHIWLYIYHGYVVGYVCALAPCWLRYHVCGLRWTPFPLHTTTLVTFAVTYTRVDVRTVTTRGLLPVGYGSTLPLTVTFYPRCCTVT